MNDELLAGDTGQKVYISYSRADKLFVDELSRELKSAGFNLIYDDSLTPRQYWNESLSSYLTEADFCVVILSEASSTSASVMSEIGWVLGLGKSGEGPKLLPVVIDNMDVPAPIAHIQAIFGNRQRPTQVSASIMQAIAFLTGQNKAKAIENKEQQDRINTQAASFVEISLTRLEKSERTYRWLGYLAYLISMATTVLGVVLSIKWAQLLVPSESINALISSALHTIVVIGFLSAVIRMAFVLGKSFTVEAIRYSDRIHAMRFGEFYIKGYGGSDWLEVKEAFQHWNIDRGSVFGGQVANDIDPQILTTIASIISSAKLSAKK